MFTRTLKTLKMNPMIIYLYLAFAVICCIVTFLLTPSKVSNHNPIEALFVLMKVMGLILANLALSLVFFTGWGNMLREVVVDDVTRFASFIKGIQRYFSKVLLATLLMISFYLGFCIVVGLVSVPFFIVFAATGATNPVAISRVFTCIIILIVCFLVPFIAFWYPVYFV